MGETDHPGSPPGPRTPREEISPWPFAGMIGMACVFFLYAATAVAVPAVPWWVVVLLLAVWSAAMVLAVRWWTPRPVALAWLPLGLALGWFAVVYTGGRWLGWV